MTIDFGNFPATLILVFLALLISLPIKVTASTLGAQNVTIIKSFLSMFIPAIVIMLLSNISGMVVLLFPVALLISIMIILEVDLLVAMGIAVFSAAIFYLIIDQFFSGITIS